MEQYSQATVEKEINLFELQIDQEAMSYLGATARWGKFLSIVGFVNCGIMVIVALLFGKNFAMLAAFGGGDLLGNSISRLGAFVTTLFIVVAVIWFFPNLFLLRFSVKMQSALRDTDQIQLNASLGSLKSCFKYIGILTIVILSFYTILFIVGIIAAAFR
jgi:amino acid permease